MDKSNITIIRFMFRDDFKALNDVLKIRQEYKVEDFSSANDVASFLSTVPAGLVIASLIDKKDLIQIATLIKTIKATAKDTVLKVVVVNFIKDPIYEKAVSKLDVQDLIDPTVNPRALKFKMDFWIKSLLGQIKKDSKENVQNSLKSLDGKSVSNKRNEKHLPVWLAPLELDTDIWLVKNDSDCKKVMGRWMIRLVGPGSFVGQWNEIESHKWRFDFKEERESFLGNSTGHWYFRGEQKPEFIWKENKWLIAGDEFDLYFEDNGKEFSRLKLKQKTIEVCKNSTFALDKEILINDTFDREHVFKKEADNLEDLEGKGNTDKLSGPLSGKNKKEKSIDKNLFGKSEGEGDQGSDLLTQETSTLKKSSYWQNQNAYQDDLEEREAKEREPRESTDKEQPEEAKKSGPKLNPQGPLGGKGATDKLPSHYNSQVKPTEKEGPKESKKHSLELNPQGPLGGKETTDKLPSHYNSQVKATEKETRPDKKSDYKEAPLKGMSGKSSGEKLSTHYKSSLSTTSPTADPSEEEFVEDAKLLSSLVQNDRKFNCRLDDYFEDTIIFYTTEEGIDEKAKVLLNLSFNYLEKTTLLKLNGDVIAIDGDGEGNSYVSLRVSAEKIPEIESFMKQHEKRQGNINLFLSKARGY